MWGQIAEELMNHGLRIAKNKTDSAEKCRQKFANLQRAYIAFVDNTKKTGSEYIPKPPFFDELNEILGEKDKVVPKFLMDSFATDNVENIPSSSSIESDRANDPLEEHQPSTSKTGDSNKNVPPKSRPTKISVKPAKNIIVETLKEIEASQRNEINNIVQIIKQNMEKQNELLERQVNQRDDFLKIFKSMCKRNKKRKRSDSSSESD